MVHIFLNLKNKTKQNKTEVRGKERENVGEEIFEEIMVKNFPTDPKSSMKSK